MIGTLSFNENNDKAVSDYMVSKNYHTALSWAIVDYLSGSFSRELKIPEVTTMYETAFRSTGHVEHAGFGLLRVSLGPATKEYHDALVGFSDESRYHITGISALKISKLYAKFGELDKARYWYDKGVKTGQDVSSSDMKEFMPPAAPPFYDGKVSGIINIDGVPCVGQHIGLIRMKKTSKINERDKNNILPWLHAVTDGTTTDASGRFTFDHLGEEECVLLLSVDTSGGKNYRVLNSPGPIKVSEKDPAADAGIINIVTE